MVAFDCVDDAHEDAQFTAESREQLLERVLQHFDYYHPEVSEEEVSDIVSANAYDPEVRARALARFARSMEGRPWNETELVEAERSS